MADLKIIICDVGNAASAIVKVPTGYSMMIDCGCNQEKNNPVDIFFNNLNWLQSKDYVTQSGVHYKLALLHITHPDDDHVRNAERVRKDLTPYLVHRNNYLSATPRTSSLYNEQGHHWLQKLQNLCQSQTHHF